MAESSILWGGIIIGDHGPYTAEEFSAFISAIYQENKATQGPIYGYLGSLEVTCIGGVVVRIASGKAIVDGCGYSNTANLDFTLTAPMAGHNYYTLVLQKDYTAQTIRAVVLGPSSTAYPTVTQDASVWEIELAQIDVDTTPFATVTDARVFSTLPMLLLTEAFADGGVALADINNGAIDYTKLSSLLYPYTDIDPTYYGTSAYSMPICGAGAPNITVEAGKSWVPGDLIRMYSRSNPNCYMQGPVVSYAGINLSFNITSYNGSGVTLYNDWNVVPAPLETSQDQLACLSVAPGTLGVIPSVADGISLTNTLNFKLQSNGVGTVPSFRSSLRGCKKLAEPTSAPPNTDVELPFNTVEFDVIGYDISANRITVPTGLGGLYYVYADAWFQGGLGGYRYIMILMANITSLGLLVAQEWEYLDATMYSAVFMRASRLIKLNAGDELRVLARHSASVGLEIRNASLSLLKLG
jgi:hypothetical protein